MQGGLQQPPLVRQGLIHVYEKITVNLHSVKNNLQILVSAYIILYCDDFSSRCWPLMPIFKEKIENI